MEDQMRGAQEAIDRVQRDISSIQDAVRLVLTNVQNLPPETVEALQRLANFAWSVHDFDLCKQTIANIDMPAVRRSIEDHAQGSGEN